MSDNLYHNEPGRVRLPKEIADQWEAIGYDRVNITTDDFYSVLWWIADMGYSIVPDADYDAFLKAKEES